MTPAISIIIPAYNEEKYIRKTLHSLQQQTFQNIEIIIVANGCTDQTENIIQKRINPAEQKIHLYTLPKAQVSKARNFGAQQAKSEILVFLDADTQLPPDALQKINQQFTSKYAIATTRILPDNPTFKYRTLLAIKNFYLQTGLYKSCSGVLICHRDQFLKMQGYDEKLQVREHHKLILTLLKQAQYSCINTYATTSMRRFDQWGFNKIFWFWVRKWFQEKWGTLINSKYEKVR